MPDQFGGPASKENTFAQAMEVNRGTGSKVRQVENLAAQLKQEGHTVDYEMRANYSGTKNGRPTSVGHFLRTVHTCYPFLFSAPAFALV